jgi:hypothetical protein
VLNALDSYMRHRDAGIQALATRVYKGIAEVVGSVEQGAVDGAPIPDIVIDDKLASPSTE